VAPARITRFASPAERQAVAERIARAHAARVQQAPSRPPSLPGAPPETDDGNDLARVGPQLKVALEAAIPFLAECYKTGPLTQSRQRRPAVLLTLTGDPSVATLIAADELRDQDGQALDSELDSCLRTTLDSLQLPPLDTTRDLHLQYSFAIDDD
jgi:hypothetical protein